MRQLFFIGSFFITLITSAQTDTSKWLRGFPITDYIVPLDDTTKLVQLDLPEGVRMQQNQVVVLYGVYHTSKDEAVQKGYGKCSLIKENYYYFTISNNNTGLAIQKGDLLYTRMNKSNIYYGRLPKLAAHFIKLLNVYDEPLYDRYNIFLKWTPDDETKLVDSLVSDIRFTGDYFLKNNPSMNVLIKTGDYKDKMVLQVMMECRPADVESFLDYINARPRNYAGNEWKVSEIFATWLAEGAPKVIRE